MSQKRTSTTCLAHRRYGLSSNTDEETSKTAVWVPEFSELAGVARPIFKYAGMDLIAGENGVRQKRTINEY